MRRSMKRLKTFKQVRPTEGTSNDPNAIPLEDIGGKSHHCVFFHSRIRPNFNFICNYFNSCCNIFFRLIRKLFYFHIPEKLHVSISEMCVYLFMYIVHILVLYILCCGIAFGFLRKQSCFDENE